MNATAEQVELQRKALALDTLKQAVANLIKCDDVNDYDSFVNAMQDLRTTFHFVGEGKS